MSTYPSSTNVSANVGTVPVTFLKCTKWILSRVPKSRIASNYVTRHLRDRSHAEGEAVGGAGHHLDHALERGVIADHPRHPADGRHRRVVRMQGQLDAGILGHRNDPLQEPGDVVPTSAGR